jgi:hypothetical protein
LLESKSVILGQYFPSMIVALFSVSELELSFIRKDENESDLLQTLQ